MPEEVKKGARHKYEFSSKQIDDLNRNLNIQYPEKGIGYALVSSYVPSLWDNYQGTGDFAKQFGGLKPMDLPPELEPYFEGDLMEINYGSGTAYLSPFTGPDFLDKYHAAGRRYERAKMDSRVAEGRGGYYGKKFGLKPMTRKRTTPFTVPKDAVVRGIGPDDDRGVDVG